MESKVTEAPDKAKPTSRSSSSSDDSRRGLTAVIVAVATLVLGFGFYTLMRRLAPDISSTATESAYVASFPEKSIAVLPFEDLSDSKKDTFLADGLQDDVVTALSKLSELKVISRTSASTYTPDKQRIYRDIAQNLGTAFILEGTIRRTGEKILITTQLTDARRDERVWSQSYERESSDVFGMQSDLVQRVASELQAGISPAEKAAVEERPTKDLIAYGLYVQGKDLIAAVSLTAQIRERLTHAVESLDQAIARDPNFYLAYCQLAAAHNYFYFFGFDHTPTRIALAEAALNTISRLRPDAGETHLAKATFYYRCYLDYDKARAELALAQRLLPNNSEIFELTGYVDRRQGLWTEAIRSLQKAFGLDPRNASLLQEIATSYQEVRQFGAMAAALDRAIGLRPHDYELQMTRASTDLEWRADTRPMHQVIDKVLARNAEETGDVADQWFYLSLCERDRAAISRAVAAIAPSGTASDLNFPRPWCEALAARVRGDAPAAKTAFLAARAEAEKTVRDQPDYGPAYTVLGLIDAGLGRKEEAIQEGRRAIEMLPITKDSIDGAEIMKYLGVIYAWCGEKDLAIQQIAATLRIPSTLSYGSLKLHPNWDSLRGDPRFEKIVADLAPKSATP